MGLIHGILNIVGLISMLVAAIFARKHRVKLHHVLLLISLLSLSLALILMFIYVGRISDFHCITGLIIYAFLLFVGLSGLFLRSGKLRRKTHKFLGIGGLTLLLLQVIYGFLR